MKRIEGLENDRSRIRHVIAVLSGKGGTGTSTVTALAAAALQRQGLRAGILDGDISFPTMTTLFGLSREYARAPSGAVEPRLSATGVKIVSMDMFFPEMAHPPLWRAPLLAGAFRQLYFDVQWGDLDFLLIDLPSGTGDIPIYALHMLSLSGTLVVTTPQSLATFFVQRSVRMVQKYALPIYGVVENMAYLIGSDNEYYAFYGPGAGAELLALAQAPLAARLPLDADLARACDSGHIETYTSDIADALAAFLQNAPVGAGEDLQR